MSQETSMLDRRRTALVVVDVQEKLLPPVFESERVVRNCVLLLRLAQVLELPVVLTTQYAKGLGATVPEVLAAAPGVTPVDKTSFGCFGSEPFLARLRELGRPQLLVAGIESHICVAQTVLGALDHAGRLVHVASDAVSSRTESNWKVGLARMERAGAVLSSTEMAVYELLARSDGAEFKRMLPFLK